jgi:membrane protein required for colicin V production
MGGVDWLIVGVVLLSVVLAASQGLIYEVFSLGGVVLGYLLAAWWYKPLAAWYMQYVKSEWTANAAGFLTIFIAVVLLAGIAGRIVRSGAKAAGLRWFDRVLGGVFGLVRGALLVTVFLLAVASWAPASPWLARSSLAPYMLVVARGAVWLAPTEVRMQFREGMRQIRQLQAAPQNAQPGTK